MLAARNLTLRIGPRLLCEALDLQIEPGQLWCVIGPNGSGKTTLLHTLAGLLPPARGELRLDGQPLADIPPTALARRRALLPQTWHDAFGAGVLETVLIGRHPHLSRWGWEGADEYHRAEEALNAVDLQALAGRDVTTLSGGERQRVAIAALLVQDAALMLLDEPVAHLDLHHQILVLDHLRALVDRGAKAALVAIHDLNLAHRYATHALVLGGPAPRAGPADEVLDEATLSLAFGHAVTRVQAAGRTLYVAQ